MKKAENLRGWDVLVDVDGIPRLVTVITHIRDDVWLVDGRTLPQRCERYRGCRRMTVKRKQMMFVAAPAPLVVHR